MGNRKHIVICLILLIILVLLVSCANPDDEVKSTDLSSISFNGMKLGENINSYDLTQYKESDTFSLPQNAQYKFEHSVIRVDKNNRIDYLFITFEDNECILNNSDRPSNLETFQAELGYNYRIVKYDSEQQLNQCKYFDRQKNLLFTIIYSIINNEIQWLTLSYIS